MGDAADDAYDAAEKWQTLCDMAADAVRQSCRQSAKCNFIDNPDDGADVICTHCGYGFDL